MADDDHDVVEISVDELTQSIIALRIAGILATRAAMPREKYSNYAWEDLDEDECNEVEKLLLWLDMREGEGNRLIRLTVALGKDTGQRDDLAGVLALRLLRRLEEEEEEES